MGSPLHLTVFAPGLLFTSHHLMHGPIVGCRQVTASSTRTETIARRSISTGSVSSMSIALQVDLH